MNVHLNPELAQLIQSRRQTGRYSSASEVVAEALHLLKQHDEASVLRKHDIRKQIEDGWHAAKRGGLADCNEYFDRGDAEIEAMQRAVRK